MSYSYITDESPRLSVDDVLGLIDWKELENVLSSPDDISRPPLPVDEPMVSMDMQPEVEPLAKAKTPRRSRKSSRSTPTKAQTPTATQPVDAPPVKKKRIRREIVELKFLRGKAKELEEQLRELQLGFSTSPRAEGEPVPLDGLMPSVWTSMAGRQLKDRMRAERENQELRSMLQDQLKIAQGLEDTLKQLPPSQNVGNQCATILPPELFGPSSSETLAESLGHLERSYLGANEAFATEGVDQLEMDKHEIKAILHPSYGTCIRFTTRIAMPFGYDVTSRAMWRFLTEEGLISLASSFNKIYTTKDIQAHCFAFRLPDSDPAKDYWMNQVVRRHLESDRTVLVGRSTVQPYVKDSSHPTGVSFLDDARVVISDSSTNGVPETCVKACVYLVPDFGSNSSNETVGINELLDFFIKSASPVILRCREMIMTMLHQEAEAIKQTAVRL
ncbi:M96 mating-specific protein family [Phytophthora cinnamomi]|uniref:M96 mating-specific protein family n=1 Tax=Phytophthora cinnamomi TaxID=4785 RepID=UPI00355A37D3|nr:M96 mating-specific protein family [Phytophthora cinnamomi]